MSTMGRPRHVVRSIFKSRDVMDLARRGDSLICNDGRARDFLASLGMPVVAGFHTSRPSANGLCGENHIVPGNGAAWNSPTCLDAGDATVAAESRLAKVRTGRAGQIGMPA